MKKSEKYWKGPTVCKGLKDLCLSLGDRYRIVTFDFEPVVYRNFFNGFEIEVSRLNNNRKNPLGTIFIWKDKKDVIRAIRGIPKDRIKEKLEEIESLMPFFEKEYWTMEDAIKCTGCSEEKIWKAVEGKKDVIVKESSPTLFIRDVLVFLTRG